jgi:nucleotide-binding universal stress UspA family protein
MISYRRILVATDFSDYSKEALDYAIYLAKQFDGGLYLLHVFEMPPYSHPGVSPGMQPDVQRWIQGLREEAEKRLTVLKEEFAPQEVKIHPVFKEGNAFIEILKAAEEIPADLIVLGTHGRTGLPHVLLGSVAERVVRKASCPVFTVRPRVFAHQKGSRG